MSVPHLDTQRHTRWRIFSINLTPMSIYAITPLQLLPVRSEFAQVAFPAVDMRHWGGYILEQVRGLLRGASA